MPLTFKPPSIEQPTFVNSYIGMNPEQLEIDRDLLEHRKRLLTSYMELLKSDIKAAGCSAYTRERLIELLERLDDDVHACLDAPLSSIEQAEDAGKCIDWGQYGRLSR